MIFVRLGSIQNHGIPNISLRYYSYTWGKDISWTNKVTRLGQSSLRPLVTMSDASKTEVPDKNDCQNGVLNPEVLGCCIRGAGVLNPISPFGIYDSDFVISLNERVVIVKGWTSKRLGNTFDITIVGGGIIGAATAMKLVLENSSLRIALVEKEGQLGIHQSGHNSGVVHAGIYYKPGSLKAKLCVQGLHLSYNYFAQNEIPYKKCGKLIVATSLSEIGPLETLYKRAEQNNVPSLQFLRTREEIKKYEPHCEGVMAIRSPETGIVDWKIVTESYGSNFVKAGGILHLNFNVTRFSRNDGPDASLYPASIYSSDGKTLHSKYVLTCGGLHSDRLAQLSGGSPDPKIIPFRGEYLLLQPKKCGLIHGNIYPVPDARFPFLGVHFTPRLDGTVWLGPNAILAFKREGYAWTDFDARDFMDAIRYKGFQKLAKKYVGFGIGEMTRSLFPSMQLRQLQKYVPGIGPEDVIRGPAGVRAQALDENGDLVEDFVFETSKGSLANRILHVRNCPSPGATSSLAIANEILKKIKIEFTEL